MGWPLLFYLLGPSRCPPPTLADRDPARFRVALQERHSHGRPVAAIEAIEETSDRDEHPCETVQLLSSRQ